MARTLFRVVCVGAVCVFLTVATVLLQLTSRRAQLNIVGPQYKQKILQTTAYSIVFYIWLHVYGSRCDQVEREHTARVHLCA